MLQQQNVSHLSQYFSFTNKLWRQLFHHMGLETLKGLIYGWMDEEGGKPKEWLDEMYQRQS